MARGLQEREERLLEQARRLEAANHRLSALQSITDVGLTHLDLDDLLQELVTRVVAATSACGGALLLRDDHGRLVAQATRGISAATVEAIYNAAGTGWLEWLESTSGPILLTPDRSEGRIPRELPEEHQLAAMVALPLIVGDRAIGLAHVEGESPDLFEEDVVALMRVFAERAARAIERAQAFAALENWNQSLESRVAEQQDTLLRTERLASIGLLGAGIAHELRNPLGVITNSLYFLRQRLRGADEKVSRHAEIIEREVQHAVQVIDGLVQFSHANAPTAYPVDVRNVFEATLERVRVPGTMNLEVDLPDALPLLQADEQRLVQVLENLVRNAVQAMGDDGTVRLSAEHAVEGVVIRVSDTGPGIDPEVRPRIFEPLVTTKAKGMGLGLALSKKMVEAWGGKIEVACPPEGGTVFRLCFDAVARKSAGSAV
jgi:signal transduction histidine kinase